jgi:iron complex outermembrane recepter protein
MIVFYSAAKPKKISSLKALYWSALFFFASPASAIPDLAHFDLPGQSMQTGLVEFALQAKVSIVVDNNLIKGYRTSPVIGPQNKKAALNQILSNAPLEFEYLPESGAYLIKKKNGSTQELSVDAIESPQEKNTGVIEEVLVSARQLPFRYNTVANTQMDGDIAYFDSSRFINFLPQQLIQDVQPKELSELLKYASGITLGDGLADSNDDVFIRGFQRHAIYIDGFRLSEATGIKLSLDNIEEVSILKGPSTLLYGQAEPGGIVNVVRKKPKAETFSSFYAEGGGFGQRAAGMDINLSSLPVEAINLRLIGSVREQDESGDFTNIHQELIAPQLAWHFSDKTRIDVGYEFRFSTHDWERDFPTLLPSGSFEGANLDDLVAQARPEFSTEFNLFNAELSHYFTDEWKIGLKYFWQHEEKLGVRTTPDVLTKTDVILNKDELGDNFYALFFAGQLFVPVIVHPPFDNPVLTLSKIRSLYDEDGEDYQNNIKLIVDGSVNLGPTTHHVMAGLDWHRQDLYKNYIVQVRDLLPQRTWPASDLDFAFFEIIQELVATADREFPLVSQEQRLLYDDYGFYIRDSIELGEQLIVSAGTRYNNIQGEFTDITKAEFTELNTYNQFSSQIGLVFKADDEHSFFINYSEALRANYHIDDLGSRKADPENSNQLELGLKLIEMDGRLSSTFALFNINKENIVDIKIIEGLRTSLEAYDQNTRGIDMDFTLQFSDNVDVIGALSLIEPEIVSGENRGKQPALAAERTASLLVYVDLTKHWDWNAGVNYVSERKSYGTGLGPLDGGVEQIYTLNSYKVFNLGVGYLLETAGYQGRFQLQVSNFFDEDYDTSIIGGTRFNPAEGRQVQGKITINF